MFIVQKVLSTLLAWSRKSCCADASLAFMQERRWFFIRNGKASDYHGPAVHWRHLSRWERHVGKLHLQYDPVLDLQQRREAKMARNSYTKPQVVMDGKVPSNTQNGHQNGNHV